MLSEYLNAQYDDVVLSDAQVSLSHLATELTATLSEVLFAVSGIVNETENFMDGEINMDGETHSLPLDENSPLDHYHDSLFRMTTTAFRAY